MTACSAYVVQGKFEHVNFIWRPAPVQIRVTEVIPPHPPKLLAMAEQVVAYDEDLPPIDLILDAVDVTELVAANPAPHYLLPCRGSGVPAEGDVSFLDTHPPYHDDWLLIGCERSRQFHNHFYLTEPRAGRSLPQGESRGESNPERPSSPSAVSWNAASRSTAPGPSCPGAPTWTKSAPPYDLYGVPCQRSLHPVPAAESTNS